MEIEDTNTAWDPPSPSIEFLLSGYFFKIPITISIIKNQNVILGGIYIKSNTCIALGFYLWSRVTNIF